MTHTERWVDTIPDGIRPMPKVMRYCKTCFPHSMRMDVRLGAMLVSPQGIAHQGRENGDTFCGKNATGPKWWWRV